MDENQYLSCKEEERRKDKEDDNKKRITVSKSNRVELRI